MARATLPIDRHVDAVVRTLHEEVVKGKVAKVTVHEAVLRVAGVPVIAHELSRISGGSLAVEMNIYRDIETRIHLRFRDTDKNGRIWVSFPKAGRLERDYVPAMVCTPDRFDTVSRDYGIAAGRYTAKSDLYGEVARVARVDFGYGGGATVSKDWDAIVAKARANLVAKPKKK